MPFYIVLEIQVLNNGKKATLATAYEEYNSALSAYYAVLSAGAINGIPYHAAYLIESSAGVKKSNIFNRMEE